MRKMIAALTLTLAFGLILPACAPAATPQAPAPEKKEAAAPAAKAGLDWERPLREGAKRGGILHTSYFVPNYEPAHLDVQNLLQAALISIGPGRAYSRLVRYQFGPDIQAFESRVTADLAESWERKDDLTYIFKLRQGVKWHNIPPVNGRELVCDDILYSYRRQLTPGFSNSSIIGSLDIDKSACLDKYTVKLVAKEPDAGFVNNLADGHSKIVAKEAVEAGGGDLKNGPTIGTGPWILEEYKKNIHSKFKRNPDFYDPTRPFLDGLLVSQFGDTTAILAAFRTRQLDIQYILTATQYEQLKGTIKDLQLWKSLGDLKPQQVGLNVNFGPFKDKRVRQAVSKCIDRKAIIAGPMAGTANLYTAGIPIPDLSWNLPNEEYEKWYERDVPLAKRLLAEAGYANGFDVEFTSANYGELSLSIGEAVVEMLKECGIRPKIKVIDAATYTTTILAQGQHQMYWGPAGGSDDPASEMYQRFGCNQSRNAVHRCDPEWDKLAKEVRVTLDPEKRKALVQKAMRYMLDASDYLAIHSGIVLQAYHPYFHNPYQSGGYETDGLTYSWLDQDHASFPKGRDK